MGHVLLMSTSGGPSAPLAISKYIWVIKKPTSHGVKKLNF